MKNRLRYLLYFLKPMGGRKRFLNLIGLGQGQRPPVFLYYTIYISRFENIIHISFYNIKTKKIIYVEPTLVLTRVCPTWVTTCRHPNHFSRAITSHTASVE